MPLTRIAAFAIVAALSASTLAFAQGVTITTDPALASLSVDEMVAKRQALMKEDGGILKGAGNLSGPEAAAAADHLITNFSNLTVLFPEGSLTAKSVALPAIWENWDTFQGYFVSAVENATAMKAAAEAGDATAYMASIKAIGGLCGQCHQQFRSE